jgi:DNA-binding winged helix-turn-helix (wHTH) protein
MQVGDIEYDHDRGLLTKGSVTVSISTSRRRAIWFLFVINANKVVTEDMLREQAYGGQMREKNAIRAMVYHLRRTLIELGSECRIASWGYCNWELIVPEDE